MVGNEIAETPADFPLDRETLAYLTLKARAYDALVAPDDVTDASDATDDRFVDALEDESDNPAGDELRSAIASLDIDAQSALIALTWLGRGDYDADEWSEALSQARDRNRNGAARYLMGMPLLGDYIADGAAMLSLDFSADEALGLSDPDIDTRGG